MEGEKNDFRQHIRIHVAERIRAQELNAYTKIVDMNCWFKLPEKEEYCNIICGDDFPEVSGEFYMNIANSNGVTCFPLKDNDKQYYCFYFKYFFVFKN